MNAISCIMNVYKNDDAENFRIAFNSVIEQTVRPTEILIIRDGIVPENMEKCLSDIEKEYNFVRIIRLDKNVGLGIGRQIAVSEAKCDLIATMDADDISVPNRFELEINYLTKNTNVDVVGGFISEFDDKTGSVIGLRKVPLSNKEIIKYNKTRCPMNHVTVMMKKSAVLKVGNYQHLLYNEDYFLWCRMIKEGCVLANIPEVLVNVRSGLDQFERRGGKKYFTSEKEIQVWMMKNKLISFPRMIINILIRFFVQLLISNKIRTFLFIHIFHSK